MFCPWCLFGRNVHNLTAGREDCASTVCTMCMGDAVCECPSHLPCSSFSFLLSSPPCFPVPSHNSVRCITAVGCSCIQTAAFRTKLREHFKLPAEPLVMEDPKMSDFVVHCACQWLAFCQEAREIEEQVKQGHHSKTDIRFAANTNEELWRKSPRTEFRKLHANRMKGR